LSSRKGGRIRDKWRLKTWLTVYAPSYFGGHEIVIIPTSDVEKSSGKIVETTLYNMTKQDISQMNIKMYFQIIAVQGVKADAIFKGHEYAREYLRSLVRRGSSRVDRIFEVDTKDGFKVRVYAAAFSRRRLKPSQETAIRRIMEKIMIEKGKSLNFDQLAQELVLGKVASEIYNEATKITPLRHVGIRKSKLLTIPPTIQKPKAEAA